MSDREDVREVWLLADVDQLVLGVHPAAWCTGWCAIHNPSDHWMRDCELGFDVEKKSLYRTCTHRIMHQDPDERTYWTEKLESARRGTNLMSMALEKLSAWSCPNCVCLCCDITTLGRSVT